MQCRLTSCVQAGSVPRPSVATPCVQSPCAGLSDRRSSNRNASCSAAPGDGPNWGQALCSSLLAVSLVCCSPLPALAAEGLAQKAVAEYVELDNQGKLKGGKALDDLRQKYRLRRTADGRVQLRSSRGEWFQCRLDMEVPGSMLLRDGKGYVYAIQTDAIQQIDLSDDLVLLMMFSDGEWEKQMAPVEYMDDKGATQHLSLQEKEFREVIGILKETQDLDADGKAQ